METALPNSPDRKDYHSFSNPDQIRVRHVDLDLNVLFREKVLKGAATLNLDRASDYRQGPLILDTRHLNIDRVEAAPKSLAYANVSWRLGNTDPILGTPLFIDLPPDAVSVRVRYSTNPDASGLQWLEPAQTAGKKHPYLYSQNQPIHARSWIPLQDSPGVRITYSATVRTPTDLLAVMSAENPVAAARTGIYTFAMRNPIPSYLIALAVGDIDFKTMGRRTGVYAEPSVVAKAAAEFSDIDVMMQAAEEMYGLYRWDRYDILVLPPSFPFGGMENPRLTFATPTIIAGDRSLVAVVAHELAHSWSGNLVTNATWRDFWLNEGFTTYIERRIQERVYGRERAEEEAVLARADLEREMRKLKPEDEILHIDLKGRDPDEGATGVPYVKGALFLRSLEELFGRERFDPFLRSYFERFAFQSITTQDFVDYLKKNLLKDSPDLAARVPLDEWLTKPGLPNVAPKPHSEALDRITADSTPSKSWNTQEWLHYLTLLPEDLGRAKMASLDATYSLTKTGNYEILDQWLLMAIRNRYEPAYPRLQEFLTTVGRRKYIKPLYEELVKTPEGKARAKSIYAKARSGYHPMAQSTVDAIVNK
jgi:aminopeptidase N